MTLIRMVGLPACALALTAVGFAVAQERQADPVVATVNGSEIRMSDLRVAHEGLPEQYRGLPIQMIYDPLLSQLIDRRMMAQQGEKRGLESDPDVQTRLAAARETVLQQSWLVAVVDAELTEAKLREHYDVTVANQPGPEEVRARHILVGSEDEARAVLDELRRGADFEAVAKERSTGPSGPRGGDLGFFKEGDMVAEFSSAAFALQPGELSDPVQTQFGWHVIKVEERRQGEAPSFEESAEDIRNQLAQQIVQQKVAQLREQVQVERFNPDGSPRVPQAPKQE